MQAGRTILHYRILEKIGQGGKPNAQEGGREYAAKGVELSWTVNPAYDRAHLPVARELLEVLRKRGFGINVVKTTEEEMNKIVDVAPTDILLERWIADYPDTDNFVGLLHSEKGLFRNYCSTAEIDRLIERGRIETRTDVRHDIYREIEHIISRRALLLPLFHEQPTGLRVPRWKVSKSGFPTRPFPTKNSGFAADPPAILSHP